MSGGGGQAIPAFVINLARRPDRWAEMSAHLAARGIDATRIDAVDGRAVPLAVLDAASRGEGPLGPLNAGTRGCTASHLAVWQALLATGAAWAFVLEDDVELASDTRAVLARSDWLPPDGAIVKAEKYNPGHPSRLLLGPEARPVPGGGRRLRPLLSRHTGSGAYFISRGAAAAGLALAGRIAVPIDHLLFNRNLSPLLSGRDLWLMTPPLARQRWAEVPADVPRDPRGAGVAGATLRLRRGWHEMTGLPRQLWAMGVKGARLEAVDWQGGDG